MRTDFMADEPAAPKVEGHLLRLRNIGIVSTRIAGTDGVSLEIGKWTQIIEAAGYHCFFIAGQCDRPVDRTFIIPDADFAAPKIAEINDWAFRCPQRTPEQSAEVQKIARAIKRELYAAVEQFQLDAIIAENALTIPMNIPLGLALVEFLLETGIPCLAHHHDFVWERNRYLTNCVGDYLNAAFPPRLPQFEHVVINSLAAEAFSRRTGMTAQVIPNVMDFERPPAEPDDYVDDFRECLGLAEDDVIILQPTRIVSRKGIEHTIELAKRLDGDRYKVVITHGGGDEGDGYARRLRQYSDMLGVPLLMAGDWIGEERGRQPNGKKRFSVWDAYSQAQLVAYPSSFEGFGNAFLEAVYFRKPVFCNRYAIYLRDIQPYGFQSVCMDGYLTDEVVEHVQRVLESEAYRGDMVAHNYEVGRRFFSYERARRPLAALLETPRPSQILRQSLL
ncbi:MAG: glycosyltransferase involved in cell wall biosynthesis [Verrucomicrobiales bacterium]